MQLINQEFIDFVDKEIPQDDSTTLEEKLFLYALIRNIKPKVCIETGTHRGKTTLYLAKALEDNGLGHLDTYDPYDWQQQGNFNKFPDLQKLISMHLLRGDQMEVTGIDFAFIDGFHETDIVMKEIEILLPRLNPDAVVVFHDCLYERPIPETVNLACQEAGLHTVWIPTFNCIRIYTHGKN